MAIQYPPAEAGPSTPLASSRLPNYQLTHSLAGHSRAVTSLKFSPDGKILVSAGADGLVHLWEPETGEHIRSIKCHKRGLNDISISPDSLYLATASDDCTSQIHNLSPQSQKNLRKTPLRHLKSHTAPILCVAFSPKSNLVVTGSFDESAIVWDVRRGKVLRVLPAHAEAIWSVCWDTEGGMVATGSADGLIRLWDASNGQCLKTLDNDTNSPVSFSTFTPSSFFLLSSTLSSTIRLYNFHTSKILKTLRAPGIYINEKHPCPAVVYEALPIPQTANNDTLKVTQNGDSMAMDIDEPITMTTTTTTVPNRRERKMKNAWVIAGSENGRLVIWELQSRRVLQVLGETIGEEVSGGGKGHAKPVIALAVHPDGRTIASGSLEPEKIIHIWRDSD